MARRAIAVRQRGESVDIGGALAGIGVFLGVLYVGFMVLIGGLPAAWLAAERGRSYFTWLLVGTLWGPLAILLVGLAPIRASGPFGPCTRCLEAVRIGAIRCPHCGWDPELSDHRVRPRYESRG